MDWLPAHIGLTSKVPLLMSALRTVLVLLTAWFLLTAVGALEPIERLTAQARYLVRPVAGFQAPVAIVAIDERALNRLGQMPWDRHIFARLVDKVAAAKAAVLGVDVAFNEPARDAAEDQALAAALPHIPTVLPTFLAYVDAAHQAMRPIEPLPALTAAAAALGSIQLSTAQQQQIWEVEPYQSALGRLVPALPVAMVGVYQGRAWRAPAGSYLWRSAPTLIDFRGPANTAPQYSAVDVLDDKLPPHALEGRLVLLGATATGLPDTNFSVPDFRGGPMAGVELSANVIDNLLASGFQRRLGLPAIFVLLALLAVFPGLPLCRGTGSAAKRSLWAVLLGGAWVLVAAVAFRWGIWLDVVPVLGLLACCYVAGLFAERTVLLETKNRLLARYAGDISAEAARQRSRIEGELHDGLQQLMVVVVREVRQALKLSPSQDVAAHLLMLGDVAQQAHAEVQRLRADLLPQALRDGGLAHALTEMAGETHHRGAHIDVEVLRWPSLPHEQEVEIYWLIKEALNNVDKHSGATHVRIRLDGAKDRAVVEVVDNGRGFTPPDLTVPPEGLEHTGLHRMWLRAQGNRADMQVESRPGQGTVVRLLVPLEVQRSKV